MDDKKELSIAEEINNQNKPKKKKSPAWMAVFITSLVLFAGCIVYILCYMVSCEDGEKEYKQLASEVVSPTLTDDVKPEVKKKNTKNPIDFKKLKSINSEIVAWIKIKDTNIDYPVLRSPAGKDDFYLHRDYYKNYLFAGSIYMESYNQPDFTDRDTILYGHNMLNGSMFADLHKFEDASFFAKHKTFKVYTPDSIKTYKVYSAFEYDNRHINNSFNHFVEDKVFMKWLKYTANPTSAIMRNVRQGVELSLDDKLITLSTCTNNRPENRYIVQGVLIKDEKTK